MLKIKQLKGNRNNRNQTHQKLDKHNTIQLEKPSNERKLHKECICMPHATTFEVYTSITSHCRVHWNIQTQSFSPFTLALPPTMRKSCQSPSKSIPKSITKCLFKEPILAQM